MQVRSSSRNVNAELRSENSLSLPLEVVKSEVIPPAPTRSESGIDWLADLGGYSWIAYGASSLLVISHLPSPKQTQIGLIFRQAFQLSSDGSGSVSAVSWSTLGQLAAALDNSIALFSHSNNSTGSFCWSKTAVLVQSTKVETIKWTGSGDGIVSGGIEVVLWRKKDSSWETTWKFKPKLPQTLVSTTWSIEGPSATAPLSKLPIENSSSPISEARKCVFVCHDDGKSKYEKSELRHPLPVSMIQWRPSITKQSKKYAAHPLRMMLLTCCLDGTVRFWCEIDDGRVRKTVKDVNDQRIKRLSFCVAAVIEINKDMSGTLGLNIFVRWATEMDGIVSIGKEAGQYSSSEDYQHEGAGRCEWLIGFGPQMLVTLWAIHCLDDVTPMRFPQVTLWKRQELVGLEVGTSSLLLNNIIILRNRAFGPPTFCSLVSLLPCNSIAWLQLNSQTTTSLENGSLNISPPDKIFSCANGILNIDGHTGKILQVAVHSYGCEVEFAASLDADGSLLFWSLSTISNCIMGLPTLKPSWQLSGKIAAQDSHPKYNTLKWAPAILDEDRVLFMGHARGVDCFIVKVSKNGQEKILCHKCCTIPFMGYGNGEELTSIHSVALPSTCGITLVSHTFMLLAIWKNEFQALSWKITIHHFDLPGESVCGCSFDIKNTFESNFAGRRYCVSVDPCSSVLPHPHNHDVVTSFAVVNPTNLVVSEEQICSNYSAYHMVTGCFDGKLKLWRSLVGQPSNSNSHWELVGALAAHEGPITTVSPTDCGRKIATICLADESQTSSSLYIWESVHLLGAGCFMLEDTLSLHGAVVALNWMTMGNGQLLLGVCLQNELQVYAQRRIGGQTILKSEKYAERKIWSCVALTHTYPAICDFFWGPKATAVVVHEGYFCLSSQWLLLGDNELQDKCLTIYKDNSLGYNGDICDFKESLVGENDEKYWSRPPIKMNVKNDILSMKNGFLSMFEVVEKFGGSLPVYHPEALLVNICSGNWKRAHVAFQHLVECLTSNFASLKINLLAKSSHVIPQVHLSNYLEGFHTVSSRDKPFQLSGDATLITSSSQLQKGLTQFASGWGSDTLNYSSTSSSTTSELNGFVEAVGKLHDLAFITNTGKMQMLAIIDLLHDVSNPQSASAYGSLDESGRRFWVAVKFQQLYFVQRFGRLPSEGELVVDLGLIGWAFHSDCQENLFSSLLSNAPSWQEMQNMGVGFWYTNATQLRLKMEKLARQQYLKNRDPKACALLYIALNRLQVLAGLFKISKDEKDKPLVGFLSRNFKEDKNKAAALKNAYVLMGRHQVELASAFFLLGGDTSSAITICAKNLGDVQLALVICRLVEGYGGPLERHLVSKILLPSAIEKGNYWFASFLEWVLGNYLQAFRSMLDVQLNSLNKKSAFSSDHASFLDSSIGQYCLMLTTKSSLKNAVGERNAAILGRWAILMSATALTRCGLPLEALESHSSSVSIFGGLDQGNVSDIADHELLNDTLRPSSNTSSLNWISGDVTFHIESRVKLDLAMQYISELLREHPSWLETNMASPRECAYSEIDIQQHKILLESFHHKLTASLLYIEQKFSLLPLNLLNMIVVSLCNNGLAFIGYDILICCSSKCSKEKNNTFDGFLLYPDLPKLLMKATEEMSYLFSRYIVACSIDHSHLKPYPTDNTVSAGNRPVWLAAWDFYMRGLLCSFWSLRATLKLFSGSCTEDFIQIPFLVLELSEYYVYFASALLQRNFEALIMIVKPLLNKYINGQNLYETSMQDLNELLPQIAQLLAHSSSLDDGGPTFQVTKPIPHDHLGEIMHSIPVHERWPIIGASLWGHMSNFLKHHLSLFPEKLEENYPVHPPCRLNSFVPDSTRSEPDLSNITIQIELVSVVLTKLLKATCAHNSSYCAKQLVSSVLQKIGDGSSSPTLLWLEEISLSQLRDHHMHFSQTLDSLNTIGNETELSSPDTLWNICADPKLMCEGFTQDNSKLLQTFKQKRSKWWGDIYMSVMGESEAAETCDQEGRLGTVIASNVAGSPVGGLSPDHHSFQTSGRNDATIKKKVLTFKNSKEIYKRNGELLEALCINSIDQQQAALASNRKGIIFFNWEDALPPINKSDYIWTEVDWPHDGWAGSESTPVPTCVSPGVGLGSKKGTHLGLGGATIGVDSLARPMRDFTGGVSGYAGMDTPHLGWEIQEDFEAFVDPPATVENVKTKAFSSHPSRPFFLVGSSNTHTYLWEFGKERAIATYGVLPAANVPPPYALASISAVQFDHCGQRFTTSALDGTVCTWQLEVGGRSNIRPTESSLCFNNHASDVTYVGASGSIIAAAGHSSDGVNVVIWDTLAPSTTSRASIMCHEGGARSLCVFNNDIGSGSMSPLIVTGGKEGDVGLHDFRYIATGRTKRNRHSDSGEHNINTSPTVDMRNKNGDQNRNGMLWYIPKAHLGSVTKISAIPNTNFFLTGGKDGDVKLWDAKRAKLVFHWPKLHDRQPSSRGFGGLFQAAVTDIQVVSNGFLTCGGDGSVRLLQLQQL